MHFFRPLLLLLLLTLQPQAWALCEDVVIVNDNYSLASKTKFSGNIYTKQSATIYRFAEFTGTLCADANISLKYKSSVDGAINLKGSIELVDEVHVSGDINAAQNIKLGGYSVVSGNISSQSSSINVESNVQITGDIDAQGTISFGEKSQISGNINSQESGVTIGKEAQITGDIDAQDIISLGELSKTSGSINSQSGVTLEKSAQITGSINAIGNVTLGPTSIVDGDICTKGVVIADPAADVTGRIFEGVIEEADCALQRTPPDFSKIIEQLENQCALIFPDPLQSHAASGRLSMTENTSVNSEDPILTFAEEFSVHDNSCGEGISCEASGTSSQSLTLVNIAKDNNSQVNEIEIDAGESLTLGDESSEELHYQGVLYDQILVEPGGELIFSSRPGEVFEINRLLVKGNAKVTFSAGQYAVYDADFEEEEGNIPEIKTTGDGTVYFFTGDVTDNDPDRDLVFNASIATGADFTVVAEGNVSIKRHTDTALHTTIYAGGELNIDGDGDLYGAFSAADISIAAGNDKNITIHPENICATPTPPAAGYYFEIVTSPDALTCGEHDVQVNVINSDDGSAVDDYNGTITLSSEPNLGVWSLKGGKGQFNDNGVGHASYQFVNSDDGTAQFSLFNSVASSLTVTVSDGDASATSEPITFRPYQFKGELECVRTLDGHCLTTANKPFQLTLTAVGETEDSDACEVIEEYTGSKSLKFWSSYLAPTDPVGFKVEIDGTQINRTAEVTDDQAQDVTFVDGVATVVANYADAGKIQIHVRDDAGIGALPEDPEQKDELQGSAITYVNPLRLVISNVTGYKRNNSKEVVSTIANPGTKQAGGGFLRASVPDYADLSVDTFDVTVDAVKDCSDPELSTRYCKGNYGERTTGFRYDITLNSSLTFPDSNSAQPGMLYSEHGLTQSPPDQGADRGQITFTNLSFSEVGTIGLSAQSLNYFDIEGNDISSEEDTQVGRFYPAYLTYGDHSFDEGCGEFTYMTSAEMDMPIADSAVTMGYVMQAKAQASSGVTAKTTSNYDASLGYPVAPNNNFEHSAYSKESGVDLSHRLLPISYYDATQWSKGIYNVNAVAMGLQKSQTGADGPYFSSMPKESAVNDQLEYYIQLTGTDGEVLQGIDGPCKEGGCRLPEDVNASSLGDFAHGRLQAGNAHGTELHSIRTLIAATYFNGSEFAPLPTDSCTPLLNLPISANPSMDENGNISVGDGTTSITLLDNILSSGKGYLQFSAPNSRGTVEYYLRLKNSADNSLYSPWLLDTENAATCPNEAGGLEECISGNLLFGLFRGSDRIIYRR